MMTVLSKPCRAISGRLAASTLLALAGSAQATPSLSFSEDSIARGVGGSHITARVVPNMEFMVAGGAVGDFDRDGDQDLFVLRGSGSVDQLFLNDGTGHFTDIAAAAGVAATHYGSGAAVADYDNDGDLDIYVTTLGRDEHAQAGKNVLYRNNLVETGSLTFTDVAVAAGVAFSNEAQGDAFSSAFGDYDLDGDLDLVVAGWNGGNRLFQNNGDGTFAVVTDSTLGTDADTIRGFVPRFTDMDGDRYPEILFIADFLTSRYYINNTDGTFTNATVSSGTGLDSNGMGNTFADFDADGDFDWYATSRINASMDSGSGNMLYMQTDTPHVYEEQSVARGANFGWWSWAADAQDFDHDTHPDIVVTNGFTGTFETDPSLLFMNDGTGHFGETAEAMGIEHMSQGRGLLTADFDQDGDRDIVIFANRQKIAYYENNLTGTETNSVTIFLDTSAIDGIAPDGFGTKLSLTADGRTQIRQIDGGSNFLAQSELSAHFGLSASTSADLTVTLPNGLVKKYNVTPGTHTIVALECDMDLVPDGVLNYFDVARFLELFSQQHPQADVSPTPGFTRDDIDTFMTNFAQGCP